MYRNSRRVLAVAAVVCAVGLVGTTSAEAGTNQADGLIRKTGKANFKGDDQYSPALFVTSKRSVGGIAKFDLKCQQDTPGINPLTMNGDPGDTGDFIVNAFIGKTKINTQLLDGIWLDDVATGKSTFIVRYEIQVGPTATVGETHDELFICGDGVAGVSGDDPNTVARVKVV